MHSSLHSGLFPPARNDGRMKFIMIRERSPQLPMRRYSKRSAAPVYSASPVMTHPHPHRDLVTLARKFLRVSYNESFHQLALNVTSISRKTRRPLKSALTPVGLEVEGKEEPRQSLRKLVVAKSSPANRTRTAIICT